jgi:hypothetical protein
VKAVYFYICRNESVEVAGTVATVAWSIWQNRNSWLWKGDKDTAKGVAIKAAHLIGEWRAINELQQQRAPSTVLSQSSSSVTDAANSQSHDSSANPIQW